LASWSSKFREGYSSLSLMPIMSLYFFLMYFLCLLFYWYSLKISII
jgi:hypothetical protein